MIRRQQAMLRYFRSSQGSRLVAGVRVLVIVRSRWETFVGMIVRGLVIMVMMVIMTVMVVMVARIGCLTLGLRILQRNDTAAVSDDHAEYQQP